MAPTQKRQVSREERLEKKRVAERARYEKIKNNPDRLAQQKEKERLKYLKKKEKGSRKSVSEMTPRQQRATRKKWRSHSASYYARLVMEKKANTFLRETTPPASGDEIEENRIPLAAVENNPRANAYAAAARKRAQKQRKKRCKEIRKKEATTAKLKTKLNCYKQKISRLRKSKELTPRTKLQKMAENPGARREVIKKALFGQMIEAQIKENYSKARSYKEKQMIHKTLLGEEMRKRKMWKISSAISYKRVWSSEKQQKSKTARKESIRSVNNAVIAFFEDDNTSGLGAGKKECIVKNKIKKQKRYLQDTMKNLHKEFLTSTNISYFLFCRLRPFWVVSPKITDRDTCLCVTHTNIQLILAALWNSKILRCITYQTLLQTLCCDRYNEQCLARSCKNCCDKSLPFHEFDNEKKMSYKQWVLSKESFVDPKTKKIRFVQKQKQQHFELSPRDLILKLENDLVKFFQHELNITHQYQALKKLKESLTEQDTVIHMDFSENYATKYNQEIQAFHFEGSRTQISLHTVVVYTQQSVTSYCTISSNLSHSPPAIWAHLKPILRTLPPSIENIHFLSDGPVTQYRNNTMFYVLGCKMVDLYPNIVNFSWNYHEAGHGKGAPDGVGAVCKRTADQVVAHGGDVTDLKNFVNLIQEKRPGVTVFTVNDDEIEAMNEIIMENQLHFVSFAGTLRIHQVTGSIYSSRQLLMKSLSCFCRPGCCDHFKLGSVTYRSTAEKLDVDSVFTDSESEHESEKELQASPSANNPIEAEAKQLFTNGEYVLVKFPSKKKEFRYVAVCTDIFEKDNELKAIFQLNKRLFA